MNKEFWSLKTSRPRGDSAVFTDTDREFIAAFSAAFGMHKSNMNGDRRKLYALWLKCEAYGKLADDLQPDTNAGVRLLVEEKAKLWAERAGYLAKLINPEED